MSNETEIILATAVADQDRMEFLPKYFGVRQMLQGEEAIYQAMRRLAPAYTGGAWDAFELSNGGFFMAPRQSGRVQMSNAMNFSDENVSPAAAGIVVTIYALTDLMELRRDDDSVTEKLIEHYHQLREFAAEHAEAAQIGALLD